MKKKATDRARKKKHPMFYLDLDKSCYIYQNRKINLPFVKRDLDFSWASAAQKTCNCFCWEGEDLLLPCVMSDSNRGGLVLKIYKCKYRRLMLQETLN